MGIEHRTTETSPEELLEILGTDGGVIVEGILNVDLFKIFHPVSHGQPSKPEKSSVRFPIFKSRGH